MDLKALVKKYSVAGPRYTSYPTAPQWTENLGVAAYEEQLRSAFVDPGEPLALYLHIPFCEALCYYCGCNIQITHDHSPSRAYVASLLKEIETAARLLGSRRSLSQISWGGGTPTFLTVSEIQTLHRGTLKHFDLAGDAEVSIEIDPRVTSFEQLESLRKLGFNRASLGVQDFNPDVQKAVNRVQSAEMTEAMLKKCRELGFAGVNFDLIYGLPFQTLASFGETVEAIVRIRPDRIALYNYAHLPSLRPHQKILEKFPMPPPDERLEIFTMAYRRLGDAGYQAIGMDHFALESDELYRAIDKKSLYRNFMGYTVKRGASLIGIGASAIGEVGDAYFQNIRETKPYEDGITKAGLSTFRGCRLTPEDVRRKWVIQRLMCRFELSFAEYSARFKEEFTSHFATEKAMLTPFFDEGILEVAPGAIRVTPVGRLFIRNVAMVFDEYLKAPQKTATYSKTL